MQYGLTIDVDAGSYAVHVQGFFDEGPTTGIRASTTFSMLCGEGIVDADMSNWMADPYDPTIRYGFLANMGE